ncbi:beta-1,3-galactosyltransferase 1-like [Palaemon carinicauda]|uniref:beta-1,3-galactosyltransferase 1-like n=1 Tax=Palaemon carinicauda TaxID=392227 RepID=UPI0035B5E0AA
MSKGLVFIGVFVIASMMLSYQYLLLRKFPSEDQFAFENTTIRNPPPLLPNKFTIEESDFCFRHPDLQIIAYVHTTVNETEKRKVTRETWAKACDYDSKVKVGVVFMVGVAKTPGEAAIVRAESRAHHDIVQGDYIDSYHTLSYKALASLRWVSTYCSHVPWTLHADDDILLDLFLLTRFLKVIETDASFICYNWRGSEVRRSGKWRVRPQEFPGQVYPPYCSGAVWILATRLIHRLLFASRIAPFLWVDDAYITGVLAKKAGIGHFTYFKDFLKKGEINEKDMGNIIAWVHIPDRSYWWRIILSHYKYIS